jgi:arabinogalactan oligomer/maltooligosaccharide transport system substrate-binding protein
MRSRFTVVVGLVLTLAVVAAACGDSETGEESTTTTKATTTTTTNAATTTTTEVATTTTEDAEPIELVIWADDERSQVLESLAPRVLEETNVRLVIEPTADEDLRGRVTTAAPAGEGPDIFVGRHDWVGEMVASGIAAPIDLGGREDEWLPVALEAFNYDGQLYGMPDQSEAVALFYNTELVPEPPSTLEDLTAICDELNEIDNCWAIPGGGDDADAYANYPFVSALGGYIFAFDPQTGYDTADVGLDSEGAIAGVTVLEQLVKDGHVKSVNGGEAQRQFEDGLAPFFLSGPWQLAGFNEEGLPYGVAKLPTIEGQPMRSFLGAGGMFINQFSENTALAQAFLLDYIANEETMTAFYDANPSNPVYVATYDAIAAGDDIAAAFARSGADGSPIPNIPEMSGVWVPLGDQLLLVRNLETDAAGAMASAAQQVRNSIES